MSTCVTEIPPPHALARRAAAGDADALAALYHRYGELVHRTAWRVTGSAAEADDVLQDVFIGLPEALQKYGARGSLEGWLRQVAVRTALMRMRRSGRRREVPLEGAGEVAASAAQPGLAAALHRALAALPEPLRTVFVLKEVEGYSHAEIAEALAIRSGTSEVRLFRARKLLQSLLRRSL
jgi:RNA polymerase sigma-70 factor (ECF subfamily)